MRTSKADREAAANVGEWLADDFTAGIWENKFVSDLAKDCMELEQKLETALGALLGAKRKPNRPYPTY